MSVEQWVYAFGSSGTADKYTLGGKGASLARMTQIGLPVPPGFTLITQACRSYFERGRQWPEGCYEQLIQHLSQLEQVSGKQFGSDENPLLVSVRSGAPESMPGMMDTILNLGLNDQTVQALAKKTNDRRFALDCYRRLIQMFGNVVLGVPSSEFEHLLEERKRRSRVLLDVDLSTADLEQLIEKYKRLILETTAKEFPQDPIRQLVLAVEAVFQSWNNPRAVSYRKLHKIPESYGTAVNIQEMVFGNLGDRSATGVVFTRNPSTGERVLFGEYLPNAQGEDVVAGIRTPFPIGEMAVGMPELYDQLKRIADLLEVHYRDMQDIEFTIEEGKFFVLQTRSAKRSAKAAVKIAVDLVNEGLISKSEAVLRVTPSQIEQLLHRSLDVRDSDEPIAVGLPASPGAACGELVFDSGRAVQLQENGKSLILIRTETSPDDLDGMIASRGILTARGGMTSHAAVVARGMGKPCICGCEAIQIDEVNRTCRIGQVILREGDVVTLDGSTGKLYIGEIPYVNAEWSEEFKTLLEFASEQKRLRVFANADTAADAKQAVLFGAEGIGLCRTEHMFLGPKRLPVMQEVILAESEEAKCSALMTLQELQQADFEEMFRVLEGRPFSIRLLDPPLHEFLPKSAEIDQMEDREKAMAWKRRTAELHEQNPMLGHRGCRLGITDSELYLTQAKAIFWAAANVKQKGIAVNPEIMIPLVGHPNELQLLSDLIRTAAVQIQTETGQEIEYRFGTMIEIPRACFVADQLSVTADFFSFGTNDLTQTTFGYSRDDAEGKFLSQYIESGILTENPFVTVDREGVGALIELANLKGKQVRPDLKSGVCGEHGGDPESIQYFESIGLDYISCSPYRVPVAIVAAAQAALSR